MHTSVVARGACQLLVLTFPGWLRRSAAPTCLEGEVSSSLGLRCFSSALLLTKAVWSEGAGDSPVCVLPVTTGNMFWLSVFDGASTRRECICQTWLQYCCGNPSVSCHMIASTPTTVCGQCHLSLAAARHMRMINPY